MAARCGAAERPIRGGRRPRPDTLSRVSDDSYAPCGGSCRNTSPKRPARAIATLSDGSSFEAGKGCNRAGAG